uniref:Uncharacterized protein n=1 Tax=Sphaerodactylus townsendi TaxID=933632 RepID=A0ACB8G963_9SAUR
MKSSAAAERKATCNWENIALKGKVNPALENMPHAELGCPVCGSYKSGFTWKIHAEPFVTTPKIQHLSSSLDGPGPCQLCDSFVSVPEGDLTGEEDEMPSFRYRPNGRMRTNCSQCEKTLTLQTSVKVLYVFVVLLIIVVVVLAALGKAEEEEILVTTLGNSDYTRELRILSINLIHAKSFPWFSTEDTQLQDGVQHPPMRHHSSSNLTG